MSGVVLLVISAASSFAWVLSAANLPQALVALLHGASPTVFMLGSIALLIVVGALLEGLPAIIILAPLLMPIAVSTGFDSVQYAIVLILAMGIGAFMPPIGIGFTLPSRWPAAAWNDRHAPCCPIFSFSLPRSSLWLSFPRLPWWCRGYFISDGNAQN